MSKLRVFVSSVQKELEAERVAIASLITTDPFLMQHCEPVLWEKEPAPARPADQPYLECLRSCQIYILLIFNEYGQLDGDVSATHHEYRLAQKLKLPTLVFLKGADDARKETTRVFIKEIKQHKHTYKRFIDREDLKPELRRGLLNLLKTEFEFEPSAEESVGGREQIEASSTFESKPLPSVLWSSLDERQMSSFASIVVESAGMRVFEDSVCPAMHTRGLLWRDTAKDEFYATAAGLLLFGQSPADHFPQASVLADAYADTKISGKPRGQLTINAHLTLAIEQALQFVDKHTFHPTRVVGINNVALDEYPQRALREALVNAVAHRNYEDASRKIMVEVFTDRVVISSPGYPPAPLTLAKLRRGNYRPCSRNPVIAQTLATFKLMEQRGSGFARMREAMLIHVGGDKDRLAGTIRCLQGTGIPIAAVRDGDTGETPKENIFKLPGTFPPEKEIFQSPAFAKHLAETYGVHLNDFTATLTGVDHHQWFNLLATKLGIDQKALIWESSRVYVSGLRENETSTLVALLKEASQQKKTT